MSQWYNRWAPIKVIDYTQADFTQSGETYDVIFEAVGKSSFSACNRVLKENGIYLNVVLPFPNLEMLWTTRTNNKKVLLGDNIPEKVEYIIFLKELEEAGKLKPVIDKNYSLEQIAEAHRYIDIGRKKGNIVIMVAYHNKT